VSRLRKTREADEDLIALYIQGSDRFGVRQADSYLDELDDVFRRLVINPGLARLRTEYRPPVRVFSFKAHVVVYGEEDEGIVILRVRHAHEDWQGDPRGLPDRSDDR